MQTQRSISRLLLQEKKSDTEDSYYMTIFIWNSRKSKTIVIENRSVVASARDEEEGEWLLTFYFGIYSVSCLWWSRDTIHLSKLTKLYT